MAVVQRRPETLRWLREVVAGPPAPGRVRRGGQARKSEPEVVATVLAVLDSGPLAFLHLRRGLGLDAALLGRVLGALAVQGRVEQVGMFPARWRLTDGRNGTHEP